MLTHVRSVLDAPSLRQIRDVLDRSPFVDGRLSAGREARTVKRTEEVAQHADEIRLLNAMVMNPLVRNPAYQAAVLPKRVAVPYYVRYAEGMGYGEHIDDPVMGAGDRYRSDVAITVFLSSPEEYEGGELEISTSFGTQQVKFEAGDAVLYPASSRHRVCEVRAGVRLVAVTWAQSLIRDPAQRELLYGLHQAREQLLATAAGSETARQVDHAYVNLVRMWAEV